MTGIVRVFDPYKYRSLLYKDGMPDDEFSELCLRQLEETILFENPDAIGTLVYNAVTSYLPCIVYLREISYISLMSLI